MKVALISDVHANIYALEAVYADLEKENVEYILVAGDLIGYYYWPKEVVSILRNDSRVFCVRGNHEENLKKILFDNEVSDFYKSKYGSGYNDCKSSLNNEELDWLINLPDKVEMDIDGLSFYVTHGSLSGIDDYIYPDSSIACLNENHSGFDFTVFGHTHYPFIHTLNNKKLINPGSVGQPRDIGGLASYVIVNTVNQSVRFKRLPFDFSKIVEAAKYRDPDLKYLWKIMSR